MLVIRYCSQCRRVVRRSECVVEPDGVFGPEVLCPHCSGLVRERLTALGWLAVLCGAVVLGIAVWWPQKPA